jgi:hypothetical protein
MEIFLRRRLRLRTELVEEAPVGTLGIGAAAL